MGTGIAHVIALGGYDVALNDLKKETVEESVRTIEKYPDAPGREGHHHGRRVKPALKRISYAPSFEAFADCDLVIEAATEDESHEAQDLYRALPEAATPARCWRRTRRRSRSRASLRRTDRPEHFIGMHFMNPVPLMELVELIRGIATDDETFALDAQIRREPRQEGGRVSEDFPAFIVNRILLPMINEAVYTLYEGVGTVEAIDKAMKLGAHHPMGPLELADFIGLDTCLSVMQVLYEGLSDSQVPAVPAAREIRRGRLARPQDPARLLRLPRREAGSDALIPLSPLSIALPRDGGEGQGEGQLLGDIR